MFTKISPTKRHGSSYWEIESNDNDSSSIYNGYLYIHGLLVTGVKCLCIRNVIVMVKYYFLHIVVEYHLVRVQLICESLPVSLKIDAAWSSSRSRYANLCVPILHSTLTLLKEQNETKWNIMKREINWMEVKRKFNGMKRSIARSFNKSGKLSAVNISIHFSFFLFSFSSFIIIENI